MVAYWQDWQHPLIALLLVFGVVAWLVALRPPPRNRIVTDTRSLNRAAVRALLDTRRGAYTILAVNDDGSEFLVEVAGFHTAAEAEAIAHSWQMACTVAGRTFRARPALQEEVRAREPKLV